MKKKRKNIDPLLKIKWEFLRRWNRYIEDYRKRTTFSRDYWRKKYGIWTPVNPAWEIDEIFEKGKPLARYGFEASLRKPAIIIAKVSKSPISEAEMYEEIQCENDFEIADNSDPHSINTLVLIVDLQKPSTDLYREFKKRILKWKRINARITPKKQKRHRPEDYKILLEVYDLRFKKRWTIKKISEKYFSSPKDQSNLREASRYIRNAKNLVEGGYRHIDI